MYEKTSGAKKEASSSNVAAASSSRESAIPAPSVSQTGFFSNEPTTSQTATVRLRSLYYSIPSFLYIVTVFKCLYDDLAAEY